jgi:AraC-like DNA-binding protein
MINQIDDYCHMLKKQYGFIHVRQENADRFIVPEELGSGFISSISPCDDVELSVMHLKLVRPLVMYYEDLDCMFEATYCFRGHIACTETGVADTCLGQNELGIYIKPHSRGMMMYPSGEEIFAVSLLARNQFYDQLPFREDCARCHNSACRSLADALMKPMKTSAQIHNLFSQIVENRLDDQLQPVFLEGAAKMILSILWQNNVVIPLKGRRTCDYCSADQRAIQAAGNLLTSCFENPPTICELSRLVGLNEYKLKNGFREMFGKTIYEHVRELRMSNAKDLLEDDNLSISQVAYKVGYINTSHFARAFRKKYGLNPSDFRGGA